LQLHGAWRSFFGRRRGASKRCRGEGHNPCSIRAAQWEVKPPPNAAAVLLAIALGAAFGAALGSFAGVVAVRGWRSALDPRSGRSHCAGCRRPLCWWENVPVLAWFALRGRCRTCRARIPVPLLAYEAIGAAAGASTAFAFFGSAIPR